MRRRKRRHLKIQMKFCFVIVMLCISLMLFNHAIDNLFANVTKDQIHNIGTRILNQSVTQLLEDESVSPDQMVEIRYQDNQSISSISVNAEQVNLVRNKITDSVLGQLHDEGIESIQIPLGSLSNFWFFSAKGPMVNFDIYPIGYLKSSITSEFDDAGINQTRHRLVLHLSLDLMCVGLMHRETVTIDSEYIISETLIMGETPQQYAQLLFEDQQEITSK